VSGRTSVAIIGQVWTRHTNAGDFREIHLDSVAELGHYSGYNQLVVTRSTPCRVAKNGDKQCEAKTIRRHAFFPPSALEQAPESDERETPRFSFRSLTSCQLSGFIGTGLCGHSVRNAIRV
jgi:hypothetical protein